MDSFNWTAVLLSSFLPLVFGGIWYAKPIFESITGEKSADRKHPSWVYVLCYFMAIPLALMMSAFYQMHDASEQVWSHGALHGTMLGLFVAVPVLSVHFSFEGDRGWRNALYHMIYWIISIGLVGSVVFAFS